MQEHVKRVKVIKSPLWGCIVVEGVHVWDAITKSGHLATLEALGASP